MKKLSALLLPAFAAGCLVYVPPQPVRPQLQPGLLVSVNQLAERLNDPGTVILHVGRRAGYDAGHIPGARFLPLSSLVTEQGGVPNELPSVEALDAAFEEAGVSNNSRVVLYGDLGGLAATRAFFTLDYLGHANVSVLNGGLESWRAAGREVTTAAPTVTRGTFDPRPRPELLATAEYVRDHLRDTTVVLIDARPPAEFSGETPGDGVTRPGHIPGAQNLFWRNLVVSEERPELRSTNVVFSLFGLTGARLAAQVERDREEARRDARRRGSPTREERRAERDAPPAQGTTVVVYCRTGVQASYLYFVSRYLGYQTKLYDGSFVDWSRRGPDFPVEGPGAPAAGE